MATVMFHQDEYQGTYYPSPVIHITLEATAEINHTVLGCLIPTGAATPRRFYSAQFLSVLLHQDCHSSVSWHTRLPHYRTPQFPQVYLSLDCCFYIKFSTPYPTTPSTFGAPLLKYVILNPCQCPSD
jgi:hypothetical protein